MRAGALSADLARFANSRGLLSVKRPPHRQRQRFKECLHSLKTGRLAFPIVPNQAEARPEKLQTNRARVPLPSEVPGGVNITMMPPTVRTKTDRRRADDLTLRTDEILWDGAGGRSAMLGGRAARGGNETG